MRSIAVFTIILVLFTFSACTNKSKQEISTVTETFLKTYHYDLRTADTSLVSKDLSSLIGKAIAREDFEVEKIKSSDSPTDKPLLIEGDIFSGFYEGQDSFKISDIRMEGDTATLLVAFTNKEFKTNWNTEVVLVNEQGWKIDNFFFNDDVTGVESTKDILLGLINAKETNTAE